MTAPKAKTVDQYLEACSSTELKELIDKVQDMYESKVDEERKEARERVAEFAKEQAGFSIDELFGKRGKSAQKRIPAAAKYRNPEDETQTWTGRGMRPNWLKAKLEAGKQLTDFAIK